MIAKTLKHQLNEQLAAVAKGLASPQRLEILEYLAQTERSVNELSQLSGLTVANTSRHLGVLKQASLVTVRHEGKKRLYRLSGSDIVSLLSSLRNTAETHLPEMSRLINEHFDKQATSGSIDSSELLRIMRTEPVTVLDVRPEKEFAAGHLPKAVNIPPDQMTTLLGQLPIKHGRKVVAYCRGPFCRFSHEAVTFLKKRGVAAMRLQDGFPQWQAAGYPVQPEHHSAANR